MSGIDPNLGAPQGQPASANQTQGPLSSGQAKLPYYLLAKNFFSKLFETKHVDGTEIDQPAFQKAEDFVDYMISKTAGLMVGNPQLRDFDGEALDQFIKEAMGLEPHDRRPIFGEDHPKKRPIFGHDREEILISQMIEGQNDLKNGIDTPQARIVAGIGEVGPDGPTEAQIEAFATGMQANLDTFKANLISQAEQDYVAKKDNILTKAYVASGGPFGADGPTPTQGNLFLGRVAAIGLFAILSELYRMQSEAKRIGKQWAIKEVELEKAAAEDQAKLEKEIAALKQKQLIIEATMAGISGAVSFVGGIYAMQSPNPDVFNSLMRGVSEIIGGVGSKAPEAVFVKAIAEKEAQKIILHANKEILEKNERTMNEMASDYDEQSRTTNDLINQIMRALNFRRS